MIINLIKNELKKEFSKKLILFSLIVFMIICLITIYYHNKKEFNDSINNVYTNEFDLTKYKEVDVNNYEKQFKIYKNKINNNIVINEYIKKTNFKNYKKEKNILEKSFIISLFAMIIISIIGSSIISYEYKGSIKLLLSKPVKRWKIYFSKTIALNIINIILLLLILIFCTIFVSIFCKVNILKINELILVGNKIKIVNYYVIFLLRFIINSIPIFFIANFSLFLSCLTLNSSISVGISVFLSIASGTLSQLFFALKFKVIQYTFLPYLDFTIFNDILNITQSNIIYGINLNLLNGVLVLLLNLIIIYFIGNLIFIKRDIKNI